MALPAFDVVNRQHYTLELFNRGQGQLKYTATPQAEWLRVSRTEGQFALEEALTVTVDWAKVPKGRAQGEITIQSGDQSFNVQATLREAPEKRKGFVENNGVVAFEADQYSAIEHTEDAEWVVVPNLGRTGHAVTIKPSSAPIYNNTERAPRLEYEFTLFERHASAVDVYLSPTLNFHKGEGLKFALSVNDQPPTVVNVHEGETTPDWTYPEWWNTIVTDHIRIKRVELGDLDAGAHTLKVWMMDPGLVFQKFVIDSGGLQRSYLGPPQSLRAARDQYDR